MFLDFQVEIPEDQPGITRKNIKGVTYIYYAYDRAYDSGKKYSVPKTTSIGKCGDPGKMYPNANYLKFFPMLELPEEKELPSGGRSACLHVGAFLVLRKLIAECDLERIIKDCIGKKSGLFLDIAAYCILTENNAGQYYPDYAYNHPLFTEGMRIYSDSTVSRFLGEIVDDQRIAFLNAWNEGRDHRQKIYISYDSTNKHCQAGDISLAEIGHEKVKMDKPIFNCAIAYDCDHSEPLFYEAYPGSINDVAQLQIMLEKAAGYGYRNIGFVLDRGYFSEPNIHYMDRMGYEFVIMVKGMKDLVSELVLKHRGTFEQSREHSIRTYRVNGMTVKQKLFPSDERDRYFHIFYSDRKHTAEREKLEEKIDMQVAYLKEQQGKPMARAKGLEKYFDLIYSHEGEPDEVFMAARERWDVINREISLCGYYVIITSEKMTAAEAIDLYKGRDESEKLFRGDKSYLGAGSERVAGEEALKSKLLIEFVALIIRNRFFKGLKKARLDSKKKDNYMTVPAALKELEKIEMIRQPDGQYRLNYAVSATQKALLKPFGLNEESVRKQAAQLSKQLQEMQASELKEMAGE